MKLILPVSSVPNALDVLRKAGYSPFVDPKSKKESFVLRPTAGFYPRFHLYLKEEKGELIFDLHIDQKKPSYAGSRMHAGEYDGKKVEEELKRIGGWLLKKTKSD